MDSIVRDSERLRQALIAEELGHAEIEAFDDLALILTRREAPSFDGMTQERGLDENTRHVRAHEHVERPLLHAEAADVGVTFVQPRHETLLQPVRERDRLLLLPGL